MWTLWNKIDLKKTVFENFMKWGLKGEFQLIQTLGFLGIHFDAVVVEIKTFFTFIQIGSGHTVWHAEVKKVKRGQGISATNAIGNIACATAPVGWL